MDELPFSIEIPVQGLGQYFLCHCESAEKAAEVVRVLCSQSATSFDRITVVISPRRLTRGRDGEDA